MAVLGIGALGSGMLLLVSPLWAAFFFGTAAVASAAAFSTPYKRHFLKERRAKHGLLPSVVPTATARLHADPSDAD
jgi:hypothetical protein